MDHTQNQAQLFVKKYYQKRSSTLPFKELFILSKYYDSYSFDYKLQLSMIGL